MPGYANPQALNRYAYVLGNPLRYTDPSGHMVDEGDDGGVGLLGCVSADLTCQVAKSERYERYKEKQRQDRLIQLIFAGSASDGSWTNLDKYNYFRNRVEFWSNPESRHPDGPKGWALFALDAGKLAANYSANQRDEFVRDFGLVFAGIPSQGDFLPVATSVTYGPGDLSYLSYSNDGLPTEYLDNNPAQNQSHHYAGLFTLGYFTDENTASFVNWGRDVDNPGDIALGNVAAQHGWSFTSVGALDQISQLIASVIP